MENEQVKEQSYLESYTQEGYGGGKYWIRR